LISSLKGHYVWDIDDVGEGAEVYAVRMYKRDSVKPLWQIKGISPDIAIVGARCYYLEVKKKLVYWRLMSCNALTGKDKQIHYEETDYRYNLEIIRGDEKHAYLRRQAGAKQDCFMITATATATAIEGLDAVSQESRRYVFGSHAGEYLCWSQGSGWSKSPELVKAGWKLPPMARAVPERLDTRRGILITRWQGCRTLWAIHRSSEPKIKWRGWGSLMLDPWDSQWIRLTRPGTEVYWWPYDSALPIEPLANKEFGKIHFAISADGTEVPFYMLKGSSAQHGSRLIVTGYGAYGLPSSFSTHMWKPLLDRGWSLAIGLWRGGGDHTPEWADAGRMSGRAKVLEDAEAVVRAAQKAAGVGPKNTLLHGRSAGGLWVGGLLGRFGAALCGGAYMEFPYLDTLRTTTNRALPLTDIEADEFGLPERSFAEFVDVASWSPMEHIAVKGLPGVLQIVRTALNDSQVYAYESVKWITRSRCANAYLAVEGAQGHFPSADKNSSQQAQDLAVILSHFG
jgi:protease II